MATDALILQWEREREEREAAERNRPRVNLDTALQHIKDNAQMPDSSVIKNPMDSNATPYQRNMRMLDSLMTKPLSPEEEKRRAHAAQQVNAVGHLGSLLTAYASLAGTTRGTTPTNVSYQPQDTQSWRDKAQSKQQQYASIQDALKRSDWEQAFREREAAREQANADRDRADRQKQQVIDNANTKRTLDLREKENEALNNYRSANLQERTENNDEKNAIASKRADAYVTGQSNKTAGGGRGNYNSIVVNGMTYKYKKDYDKSGSALDKIYNLVDKEFIQSLDTSQIPRSFETPDAQETKKMNVIQAFATQNPDWMDEIYRTHSALFDVEKNKTMNYDPDKEWFGPPRSADGYEIGADGREIFSFD